VRHQQVWDWRQELQPGDLLVVNDTRVLKVRLRLRCPGGGLAELLVLEPLGDGQWLCLGRPAKKLRPGDQLWLESLEQETLGLEVLASDEATGGRLIQFPRGFDDAEAIEGLLERYGEVTFPPYINRHDADDHSPYQTRYAARPGAVSAPTAGLHLSDALLAGLAENLGLRTLPIEGIEGQTFTL
jgi:S-adenosylmethionine:tRNA ribosyltransferase-isomerase